MTDVAIIGSGPSGLTAAKAMVEHGLAGCGKSGVQAVFHA
jgi:flavin-dependent dehydrogenase